MVLWWWYAGIQHAEGAGQDEGDEHTWTLQTTHENNRKKNAWKKDSKDRFASNHQDEDQPTFMHPTCLIYMKVDITLLSFRTHSLTSLWMLADMSTVLSSQQTKPSCKGLVMF